MVITKSEPFTQPEIIQLSERFSVYVKTVIDVEKKICCAGVDLHADGERLLLSQGSLQKNIWGGGVDLESRIIDFNSFINIRPSNNNLSNEIQDPVIRQIYEDLTKYFFNQIYE